MSSPRRLLAGKLRQTNLGDNGNLVRFVRMKCLKIPKGLMIHKFFDSFQDGN